MEMDFLGMLFTTILYYSYRHILLPYFDSAASELCDSGNGFSGYAFFSLKALLMEERFLG